jgi:hypothetical protein
MPSKKELTEELIRISRETKEEAKKLTEKQNALMKEIQIKTILATRSYPTTRKLDINVSFLIDSLPQF